MKLSWRDEDFGRYEKRLCVLILLASILNPFPVLQPLVTQYTPDHHCDVEAIFNVTTDDQAASVNLNISGDWREELLNLTIPWSTSSEKAGTRSQCHMYNMTRPEIKNRDVSANKTYETIICGVVHFTSEEEVSSVTEFGTVCRKAWEKPLITSMYMLGLLIGGIVCGVVSDSIGRRAGFLIFTFVQFAVVFASAFSTTPTFLAVLTFLTGLATLGNFVCAILLGTEFMPTRLRSFAYLSVELGYSIGSMIFPLFAYYFRNWRWYLGVTGSIGIAYIPYCWLIDESPLWLLASGQEKDAEAVMQKVARFNGKPRTETEELQKALRKESDASSRGLFSTVKELATSCTMVSRCFITAVSWLMVAMSYYAMKLNMNNLSGDRFLNMFYGGLTEFGATLIFYLAVETRGRRQSYIGFMALTAVFMTIASFATTYSGELATGLSMICQLSISVAFNVVYVYTGELFPTKSRHSVLGMNMIGARLGGFFAPFIIYAGENGSTLAPSIGTAVAIAVSAISFAFLPETKGAALPMTVKDAEELPRGWNIGACCRTTHAVEGESGNPGCDERL